MLQRNSDAPAILSAEDVTPQYYTCHGQYPGSPEFDDYFQIIEIHNGLARLPGSRLRAFKEGDVILTCLREERLVHAFVYIDRNRPNASRFEFGANYATFCAPGSDPATARFVLGSVMPQFPSMLASRRTQ